MGDRIKFHRERLGLTQEQLAERLGVSAQAVSKWENNLSCPDISILPELASIFGISVDALEVSNSFGQLTLLIPEKSSVVLEPKSTSPQHLKLRAAPPKRWRVR